ncbi:MAG: DUF58 domain-containing protein [Pseudoclavibacter sp.]|nr:DUF58 domain-containing protein [Pseudoclavibacter sp.]
MTSPRGTSGGRSLSRTRNVSRVGAGPQPSRLPLSALGWIVLAGGVALVVLGLWLSWLECLVMGGVLLLALAAAVPFILGRSAYGVDIDLHPRRVMVGQTASGRLLVRNAGASNLLPSRFELPVGGDHAEFAIPALPPAEVHEELFTVPTSYRGVIPAGPASSVRGDALGLLRRTVRWTEVIELFVHPRTVRLETSASGLRHDLEGVTSTKVTDRDLAFHALRPYEAGDDRRSIHWRTTARTGRLMVRQFEETRRSQLTIGLTVHPEAYVDDEEFELAVSVAASIAQQFMRDDLGVDVVTERGRLRARSLSSMLDETSRIEPLAGRAAREPVSLRGFLTVAVRKLAPPTAVVLVCGSRTPTAELLRAAALFAEDVQLTAFRCDVKGSSGRGRGERLDVRTVAALEDLPGLVRRRGGA